MLSIIHNHYHHLTETEKKIADTVLSAPQEAIRMTVQELAQHSNTAPSAVIRFCKSIGSSGFSDFKISLSKELGQKKSDSQLLPVCRDDTPAQVFDKVFASGVHTLQDTLAMMDLQQVEQILHRLQTATRVVFFGVGTSSVIATDAQYRFAQLGLSTAACTDILFMNVTAANLTEGDVAIGVSHSGTTKATVDALRRAKKAGACTVAITSFAHSLLAKESDHHIIAFSDEKNYPVEAVSARIAHMCILDALMMSLATKNYSHLDKYISERNEVLREIRYRDK